MVCSPRANGAAAVYLRGQVKDVKPVSVSIDSQLPYQLTTIASCICGLSQSS